MLSYEPITPRDSLKCPALSSYDLITIYINSNTGNITILKPGKLSFCIQSNKNVTFIFSRDVDIFRGINKIYSINVCLKW